MGDVVAIGSTVTSAAQAVETAVVDAAKDAVKTVSTDEKQAVSAADTLAESAEQDVATDAENAKGKVFNTYTHDVTVIVHTLKSRYHKVLVYVAKGLGFVGNTLNLLALKVFALATVAVETAK